MEGHDVGTLRMLNAGVANFSGVMQMNASLEPQFTFYALPSATYIGRFNVSAAEPFAWGVNDTFFAYLTYKAA
jgi:hypothetical protein